MPVRVVLDISVAVCGRRGELVLVEVHDNDRRVCCFSQLDEQERRGGWWVEVGGWRWGGEEGGTGWGGHAKV